MPTVDVQVVENQVVDVAVKSDVVVIGGGASGGAEIDPEIFKKDVIIPETSLTMTEYGSGSKAAIHSDGKVEIGKTYTVIWNGVKYSCVGKDPGAGYDSVILGNGLTFGLPQTDEPFCLRFYNDTELTENVEIFSLDYIATATVEVTTPQTINPKYIPDMYYTEGGTVEILPETTLTASESDPGDFMIEGDVPALVIGETYVVKWNGTEYTATAFDASAMLDLEGAVMMVNDGTDLSTGEGGVFVILYVPGIGLNLCDMVGDLSATVSITHNAEKIHKIPNKYLDLEWLPIMKETELTNFSGTIDDSNGVINNKYHYFVINDVNAKVYANLPTYSTTIEGTTIDVSDVVVTINGNTYKAICFYLNSAYNITSITDEMPFILQINAINNSLTFGAIDDGDYTVSISTKEPNKLPEKFLPEIPVIDITAHYASILSKDSYTVEDASIVEIIKNNAEKCDKIILCFNQNNAEIRLFLNKMSTTKADSYNVWQYGALMSGDGLAYVAVSYDSDNANSVTFTYQKLS